jgi:hypothetical protein
MSLISFKRAEQQAPAHLADVNLRDLLMELGRYGKPRVSMGSAGWVACIEMNTNVTGSSFEVRSEFGHTDPLTAALECRDRIRKALEALGAKT